MVPQSSFPSQCYSATLSLGVEQDRLRLVTSPEHRARSLGCVIAFLARRIPLRTERGRSDTPEPLSCSHVRSQLEIQRPSRLHLQ